MRSCHGMHSLFICVGGQRWKRSTVERCRVAAGGGHSFRHVLEGGESVFGCMCVYAHTHTHTLHVGYQDVSPGVGTRHLEGLKNSGGLNLGVYSSVYLYKVLTFKYMLGGGMRSWTACFDCCKNLSLKRVYVTS